MSAKRRELVPDKPTGECLPGGANSVSKQETASFEGGNLAWEVGYIKANDGLLDQPLASFLSHIIPFKATVVNFIYISLSA